MVKKLKNVAMNFWMMMFCTPYAKDIAKIKEVIIDPRTPPKK